MLNTLFECVQEGWIKIANAAQKAKLSPEEFKEQMRQRGFTLPQQKGRAAAKAKGGEKNS